MSRLVAFEVGGGRYALPVEDVEQIVRHEGITEVPQSPPFVEGVINVRGDVIPVVDVRRRFGLSEAGTARKSRVIITRVGAKLYGLHVDDVREIVEVPDEQVQTRSIEVPGVRNDVLRAVAEIDGELLIVLDMERILSTAVAVLSGGEAG